MTVEVDDAEPKIVLLERGNRFDKPKGQGGWFAKIRHVAGCRERNGDDTMEMTKRGDALKRGLPSRGVCNCEDVRVLGETSQLRTGLSMYGQHTYLYPTSIAAVFGCRCTHGRAYTIAPVCYTKGGPVGVV